MTSVDKDVQLDSSEAQVRYVTWVVRDNENWNNYGISEEDIGVCFEMSGPLAFDGRHSVARSSWLKKRSVSDLSKSPGLTTSHP